MLVTMRALMRDALNRGYAVGYFEAWNMDAMNAVVNAAEREKSPVIIGFSGNFLGNPERVVAEQITQYGAVAAEAAKNAAVPIAVLLNESPHMALLVRALGAGFNAVMYQKPGEAYAETLRLTKYLCETAHYFGADVESEVGELPTSDISAGVMTAGEPTDPGRAVEFVRETGIDALAIACGNVHLLEGSKSALDFALIEEIRRRVDIPVVLHGGTGISEDDLRRAIELGVAKVNVGTVMKRVYINTLRGLLSDSSVDRTDPHALIGGGGRDDLLVAAREAVTDTVRGFIRVFGGTGRAEAFGGDAR